jgi:hypothetical protein
MILGLSCHKPDSALYPTTEFAIATGSVPRQADKREISMGNCHPIKRILLYMVVGGLVLAALAGIYVLLFGTFGRTEQKILLTTLAISYFSVTSLACAAEYEKRRHGLLSILGLALGIAGFVVFLPSVWAEWLDSDAISKTTIILAVFSFSFAQACLLSLVKLERRVVWVYYAAVVAILALAAIISAMIVCDEGGWMVRFAGAVGILDGCLSLCIPVLHRLGGTLAVPTTAATYQQIELVCPRCGQRDRYPIGLIRCRRCSLAITIRIEADSHEPIPVK